MSLENVINKLQLLLNNMIAGNESAIFSGMGDLANIVQHAISENPWPAETLKKFNALMENILISIEKKDFDSGICTIKQVLMPLMDSISVNNPSPNKGHIDEITAKIQDQYTDFMYPDKWKGRIPGDLRKLVRDTGNITAIYNLEYIQHIACQKMTPVEKLDVLVAGCGTGEDALTCALAYPDTSFTMIDISPASLKRAQEYASELELTNVEFQLADIMNLDLHKKFDIIISIGVIHHLSEPSHGVANLKNHLKDSGALVGMVYGEYGRFEIGLFQEAVKTIQKGSLDFGKGIDIVNKLFNDIDPSNRMVNIAWKQDIKKGDQHLVDLLLNVNENRYTVYSLSQMLQSGGMKILEFVDKSTFNPGNYVSLETAGILFENLSYLEKCRVAELINGRISKHHFYAIKDEFDRKQITLDGSTSKSYVIYKSPYLLENTVLQNGNKSYYLNLKYEVFNEDNKGDYKNYHIGEPVVKFLNLCNGKRSINDILRLLNHEFDENSVLRFVKDAVSRKFLFIHEKQ